MVTNFDLIYLRPDRNDVRINNLISYRSMKKKIQSIFFAFIRVMLADPNKQGCGVLWKKYQKALKKQKYIKFFGVMSYLV